MEQHTQHAAAQAAGHEQKTTPATGEKPAATKGKKDRGTVVRDVPVLALTRIRNIFAELTDTDKKFVVNSLKTLDPELFA
jgi:hypothetical protein